MEKALKSVFRWELNILLTLLGHPWTPNQQIDDYKELMSYTKSLGHLGKWVEANIAARLILPIYFPLGEAFATYIGEHAIELELHSTYSSVLSVALYQAGHKLRAFDLLEETIVAFPQNVVSHLALAHLFMQINEMGSALDTYQRAIEANIVSADLYLKYAELLVLLDAGNVALKVGAGRTSASGRSYIEDYILIDESITEHQLTWEAVELYQAALQIQPDDILTLSYLLMQLADLQSPSFWTYFPQLVELDLNGEAVRDVINTLYNFDDLNPAILILMDAVKEHPNNMKTRLNLAAAFLLVDRADEARQEIELVRSQSSDAQLNLDADRLMLSVDDTDFEQRLGDITEQIDAGNEPDLDDVEFLENALENAPQFSEAYILLADAYLAWDEVSDALNVLLDGQKHLPDDPEIGASLARVLWQSGEFQLALDYLNKTLAKNPVHVPSLALAGRLLFEDGQEDAARSILSRAEAIDPQHPALRGAKAYIANSLNM